MLKITATAWYKDVQVEAPLKGRAQFRQRESAVSVPLPA